MIKDIIQSTALQETKIQKSPVISDKQKVVQIAALYDAALSEAKELYDSTLKVYMNELNEVTSQVSLLRLEIEKGKQPVKDLREVVTNDKKWLDKKRKELEQFEAQIRWREEKLHLNGNLITKQRSENKMLLNEIGLREARVIRLEAQVESEVTRIEQERVQLTKEREEFMAYSNKEREYIDSEKREIDSIRKTYQETMYGSLS